MAISTSESSLPPTEILTSESQIPPFLAAIALTFHTPITNPFTTAFVTEIDSTPPPYPQPSVTTQRFEAHFRDGFLNAFNAGATLITSPSSSQPSALAIWEGPDYEGVPFDQSRNKTGPILSEWKAHAARMRSKYLGEYQNNFWHLGFLARNPDPNVEKVKGAISAVVLPFLAKAKGDKVPAWLEATGPEALKVYEHFGWRVCEKVTIGVGIIDERGWPKEGGAGASAWGMIYDVHLK